MNRKVWGIVGASGMMAALVLGNSITASAAPAQQGKFKIGLCNSFMGNDWRQEMERVAKVVANEEPFKSKVQFSIVNTDNTPAAQSAAIDAMVQQGYKAILVDASSPTALNSSIERAIKAGVVVVSFDQTVTAPDAYKIETDFKAAGTYGAEYLAKAIHGHGNVVVDTGLPGAPISLLLTNDAMNVFKKYPGIKVVGTFAGQYAEGPTKQGMENVLASQPKVDAVYTQGYITSVYQALTAAHRPLVPVYGQAYNGNYVALTKKGANGIITVNSPGLGALALQTALNVLQGKKEPKSVKLKPEVFVTDTSIKIGVPVTKIKLGVNAFPDLPPGLTWPAAPPQFHVTVQQALGK
ncbi:MAG: substrate-binding domain-containing protein [Alicyclobacillus sp.]|nr:substrate-binding domain-containing protein [Alicyclobacillus sp.]